MKKKGTGEKREKREKGKNIKSCCSHKKTAKKCKRTSDNKVFNLPRKLKKETCLTSEVKGYTMRSSCAPYRDCAKKEFLYNKKNPSKSFNVYIDKNPNDTIPIKYKTLDDVKRTIKKLERLYKSGKYSHKRIWQVGMILYVRLKVLYKNKNMKKEEYNLAKKYFEFLGKRTKIKKETKENTEIERKKLKFVI